MWGMWGAETMCWWVCARGASRSGVWKGLAGRVTCGCGGGSRRMAVPAVLGEHQSFADRTVAGAGLAPPVRTRCSWAAAAPAGLKRLLAGSVGTVRWAGKAVHREGFSPLCAGGLGQEYHISLRYSGSRRCYWRAGEMPRRGMRTAPAARLPTTRSPTSWICSWAFPCSCSSSLCSSSRPEPAPAHPAPGADTHPVPRHRRGCDPAAWRGAGSGRSRRGVRCGEERGRAPAALGALGGCGGLCWEALGGQRAWAGSGQDERRGRAGAEPSGG